ncbi:XP_036359420.1uncharacterized protein LOC118763785 [Octopus vulgaris]|uniref:XP_036359420.1uncharacterized protein LOC118763785 n=1 Tax=Octopus vulgaris TaxID=6645 RepID=A0AA36BP46_OCTVU|nr:XP_036359420.1uncharacterized protein LOC118763785 [Octopus vulgaris]
MIFRLKSKGLVYCSPLVNTLLAGIDKRFRTLLEDEECQMAAAFHLMFCFILLKYDNTKITKVRKSTEGKVEEAMGQQSDKVSSNSEGSNSKEEKDDFFSGVTQPKESSRSHRSLKDKAQNLIKTWLETDSKDLLADAAFLSEQVLADLFIKFSTAIPSSAAVKHLFSIGKDIMRAKRSSFSDGNIDMLVFMKGNMYLMNKMENEKKN